MVSGAAGLAAHSEALYELLVRPADAALAGSRRLLISADGPLNTLYISFSGELPRNRFVRKPIAIPLS